MSNDNIITIEEINDDEDEQGEPIIGIYRARDGSISFSTKLNNPIDAAKIFNGLTWHILEHLV